MWARVRPAFARAPADVRIEARVAPNDVNRRLEIVVESEAFYRSSAIPLDGAQGPRVFAIDYRAVPAGDYEVRVLLIAQKGDVRAVERTVVQVTP